MAVEAAFWHGVELRHFTTFEAIAREGSFSAAAQALGYTQSAVSGHVAHLEAAIGVQLFRRLPGRRGVEMTTEGTALLAHIPEIFSRLRAARADIEAIRFGGVTTPKAVIGTFPSLSSTFLPSVLARLAQAAYPLHVELREDPCGTSVMAAVERGELDAAFTTLPLPDGPYRVVELFHDPYYLVTNEQYRVAQEDAVVPLARLGELPVVAQFRGGRQAEIEDALGAAGITLNAVRRADTWASILALAEAGEGFGLVPALALANVARRLTILPIESGAARRTVVLAWHADRLRAHGRDELIAAAVASASDFCPRIFAEAPVDAARVVA